MKRCGLGALALVLVGCGGWWRGREPVEAAAAELTRVLGEHGVEVDLRSCRRVPGQRGATMTCTTRLTEPQIQRLRDRWGLSRVGPVAGGLDGRCVGLAGRTSAQILSTGTVDPMDGTELSGVVLVWDAATGETCVGSRWRP